MRGKFTALNTVIKNKKMFQINNLSFYLRKLGEKEQNKPWESERHKEHKSMKLKIEKQNRKSMK